jgi:hypothetical protein
MLPEAWKKEIDASIGEAAERNAEDAKRQIESRHAISAPLNNLANEFVSYKNEQRKTDEGKSRREIATIWLLFVNAALVFITAGIFYGQLHEMQKVYGPVKTSADAAKDSADILRYEQRPWVTLDKIDSEFESGNVIFWQLFKNVGHLLAMNVYIDGEVVATTEWEAAVPKICERTDAAVITKRRCRACCRAAA